MRNIIILIIGLPKVALIYGNLYLGVIGLGRVSGRVVSKHVFSLVHPLPDSQKVDHSFLQADLITNFLRHWLILLWHFGAVFGGAELLELLPNGDLAAESTQSNALQTHALKLKPDPTSRCFPEGSTCLEKYSYGVIKLINATYFGLFGSLGFVFLVSRIYFCNTETLLLIPGVIGAEAWTLNPKP